MHNIAIPKHFNFLIFRCLKFKKDRRFDYEEFLDSFRVVDIYEKAGLKNNLSRSTCKLFLLLQRLSYDFASNLILFSVYFHIFHRNFVEKM